MKINQKSLDAMKALAKSFDDHTLADRLNSVAMRPNEWTNEEKIAFQVEAAERLINYARKARLYDAEHRDDRYDGLG